MVDIVKRDNKEGKMKSVLKGAAGALAVMSVALSAKGDVIIEARAEMKRQGAMEIKRILYYCHE